MESDSETSLGRPCPTTEAALFYHPDTLSIPRALAYAEAIP